MQNPPLYNPFTVLPSTLCENWNIPAISTCQDEPTYRQRRSEVYGLLLLPTGAEPPGNWENIADWVNTVDNTNTNDTKAKYLVGIGSFLPDTQVEVSLAGGRLIENRERTYRLNMAVLNIDDGHTALCRKLQTNARRFTFWLITLGDRLVGGPSGIRPQRVNADFVLASGNNSREVWNITFAATFLQYPEMTSQAIDFTGAGLAPGGGTGGGVTIVELSTSEEMYTYNIPTGTWLVGWEVRGDDAQSVSLGLTSEGQELGGPVDLLADQTWVGQGNMTKTNASFNIYFSGMTGNNSIKLWLLG